jgi:hypothetical protein
MGRTYKDQIKSAQRRQKLISHYELIRLVESQNPRKDSIRKKIAVRNLQALKDQNIKSCEEKSRVLTLHEYAMQCEHERVLKTAKSIRIRVQYSRV